MIALHLPTPAPSLWTPSDFALRQRQRSLDDVEAALRQMRDERSLFESHRQKVIAAESERRSQEARTMLDDVDVDSTSDIACKDRDKDEEQSQDDKASVASSRYASSHSKSPHHYSDERLSHSDVRSTELKERMYLSGYHGSYQHESLEDDRSIIHSRGTVKGSAKGIAVSRAMDELGREISHITEQIQLLDERRAALSYCT